jgi:uncharacterized protein DUF1592/uncharacterized protein DUF1588/uncharacterized protein DUF1587/uncharacterized protein DUF1595/uncharacterized protein DUF1585
MTRAAILFLLAAAASGQDPGRLVAHRLNRAEYNNTIRDLTGAELNLAATFPADDSGYGFDNIGDVLTLSPVLMERYLAAADIIVHTPEARRHIFLCGHESGQDHQPSCARTNLAAFARRAYRRPVTDAEVDRLIGFVHMAERNGDTIEQGVLVAVKAMLVSPQFLFRIEDDSEVALASRLSYFLWSSMPDEELLRLVEERRLRAPGVLEAQVRRMLADSKSRALVENFTGQWLQLRNLDQVSPDPEVFPGFNTGLRNAMRRETTLFFEAMVREDRSIFDFIDADFTFLNERLAKHYGIDGVTGPEFRRVTLEGDQRGGVLTQASVLTVSSYPTRTSPVLRGKFLLDNFLNAPPPPPPPGVQALRDLATGAPMPMRARLEQHRTNPVCASCHARMDPLGFALENYDGIGRWRTHDGEFPIDSPGPAALRKMIRSQPDALRDALASKLLTYALGRGLEPYDQPAVETIRRGLEAGGDRFSQLAMEIVKSAPFQMRRGDVE